MSDNSKYWENRRERAKKAYEHTVRMKENFFDEIRNAVEKTKLYGAGYPFAGSNRVPKNMEICVNPTDTVSAILNEGKSRFSKTIAALNFASYKEPGGMFLQGSRAQEECLCHESFLYNVLVAYELEFYAVNRQKKNRALYINRGLYSPEIQFMRNSEKVSCDVITVAAPNRSAAQKYMNVSDAENFDVLKSRIHFVLQIAEDNYVDTLILGAYGCGVFGQNPEEVARLFKDELESGAYGFERVVFAILSGKDGNLEAFRKVFF